MEESHTGPLLAEQEWDLDFHGISYTVNVLVTDLMLTLEIENTATSERWSGEFTAQYIEEITHKAGNFKKFGVFTTMLCSAFSKDNDSVIVDILTFSDLEMLKARKLGGKAAATSSFSSNASGKQLSKRYAILTYSGEFDRVHYPLPLAFEEKANVPALKRHVVRLRKALKEREEAALQPANDKERELRQIISQLRQDNTELRHRLRQQGGNTANSANGLNNSYSSTGNASPYLSTSGVNAELASANTKLRKQVDALKRELSEASLAYEKLRTQSAKEVSKWKMKLGSGRISTDSADKLLRYENGYNNNKGNHPSSGEMKREHGQDNNSSKIIAELRGRLLAVEKELKFERLSRPRQSQQSRPSKPRPWNTSVKPSAHTGRGQERPATNMSQRNARSLSPSLAHANRTKVADPKLSRSPRPTSRNNDLHSYSNNTARSGIRRSSSASPSSSLGGRFDPTAYQRAREQKQLHSSNTAHHVRAWGAGSGLLHASSRNTSHYTPPSSSQRKHRYRSAESGYLSANSQSSAGSQRSDRTGRSQRSTKSNGSNVSVGKKKKPVDKSGALNNQSNKRKETNTIGEKINSDRITTHSKRRPRRNSELMKPPSDYSSDSSSGTAERFKKAKQNKKKPTNDTKPIRQSKNAVATMQMDDPSSPEEISSSLLHEELKRGSQEARVMQEFQDGIAGTQEKSVPSQSTESSRNAGRVDFRSTGEKDSLSLNKSSLFHKLKEQKQKPITNVHRQTEMQFPLPNKNVDAGDKKNYEGDMLSESRNLLSNPDEDISEIDKRIQALQNYLDNARVGILAAERSNGTPT